ncbi:MAG: hypothetical protein UGF89_06485 [Acutalibacteraceae bacterium]|nr:hypothetical protein [Acutalibacteraceae bacterium]
MKLNKEKVIGFIFVAIEFVLLVAAVVVLSLSISVNKTDATPQKETVERTEKVDVALKVSNESANYEIPSSNFELVSEYDSWADYEYYRDKATDVMYVARTYYKSGGLTEMTDPKTGLPLTYENYLKYQEEIK